MPGPLDGKAYAPAEQSTMAGLEDARKFRTVFSRLVSSTREAAPSLSRSALLPDRTRKTATKGCTVSADHANYPLDVL